VRFSSRLRRHACCHSAGALALILLGLAPTDAQASGLLSDFRPELLWALILVGSVIGFGIALMRWSWPARMALAMPCSAILLWLVGAPWWMVVYGPLSVFFVCMHREWEKMFHGGRIPKNTSLRESGIRPSASLTGPGRQYAPASTRWQTFRRVFRHCIVAPLQASRQFSPAMQAAIRERVAESESGHLGEIVVALETRWLVDDIRCGLTPAQHARNSFSDLGVWNTELNNGVLIHVVLGERAIGLVADRGIAERVAPGIWQGIVDGLASHIKNQNLQTGLLEAIDRIDSLLREHFPAGNNDNPDELANATLILGPR
jgi:hypothetical protein